MVLKGKNDYILMDIIKGMEELENEILMTINYPFKAYPAII